MPNKYVAGEHLDISVERNGSFARTLILEDTQGGPVNLSGVTFSGQVRLGSGIGGSPIASFTISVIDEPNGQILFSILGSALDAVEGMQEVVTLAYDIKAVKSGVPTVIIRGNFYLNPEVTP